MQPFRNEASLQAEQAAEHMNPLTMKATHWIWAIVIAGVLTVPGCKPSSQGPVALSRDQVTFDMPKLHHAFASAGPETQAELRAVSLGIRYGQYTASLTALDKLASSPNMTDDQKKAVNELMAQVKRAITNAATQLPGQ
jgi:hypothetical protein